MEWYLILLITIGALLLLLILSALLYKAFFKRFYDIFFSAIAILIMLPLFIVLTLVGFIAMKGNPFFVQRRPGKSEKIFHLIKFRSMMNKMDENNNLLSDEDRLNGYGKFIRKTSLDELPELFNIFIGNMSIVGPRPLLEKYLPLYNDKQRRRHLVRPGLTGLAQVSGRNGLSWNEKFDIDVFYTTNYSMKLDLKIVFKTIIVVLKKENIGNDNREYAEEFKGNEND